MTFFLFGEANVQQLRVMESLSGQRINIEKSKLHVSRNVDVNLALHFSQLSGIPPTNGLGTYLGIPLFHNRGNRGMFNPLLAHVRGKLGGLSSRLLSRAGRRVLIRLVGSTISAYMIQVVKLPCATMEILERTHR